MEAMVKQKLKGSELLDFVEAQVASTIGVMILDGMGFPLQQKV